MELQVSFAAEPEWIGRSITGEGGRSDTLRAAIRAAQLQALEDIDPHRARHLTIRWETEDPTGRWHWNPSISLHDGTSTIFCIAEWEED